MKKINLTEGKVPNMLIMLAIPIMGSSLLQFGYNLIDMLWVGRLGSNAVASIGSSSFFLGLGYAINALVVIGTGIKVAHSIGRGNEKETKEYINTGLFMNFIVGILYALFLIFSGKFLIGFLDLNNPIVEKDSLHYLMINAPTLFFAFLNFLFTRIFGSYGNNKEALKISAVGITLNIILDPICIYGLDMGVLGAGVATLIGTFTTFILFIIKSKGTLKYDFDIGVNINKAKEIARLGFPMAFQRVLFTLVNIILAKIIAHFGSDAIAGQKIGLQIESITFMVIGGLNGAVSSFTGQNFGAKKYSRIKEGYKTALKIGVCYALSMSALFLVFKEPLIRMFVKEEGTIIMAYGYLQAVVFSQAFSAVEMVSNAMFTGLGKPKISAKISIIFTVLRIPMALILIPHFGVNGIWISIALSSILKGVTAYLVYLFKIKKELNLVEIT